MHLIIWCYFLVSENKRIMLPYRKLTEHEVLPSKNAPWLFYILFILYLSFKSSTSTCVLYWILIIFFELVQYRIHISAPQCAQRIKKQEEWKTFSRHWLLLKRKVSGEFRLQVFSWIITQEDIRYFRWAMDVNDTSGKCMVTMHK
jgi:hypothetical protein